MTQGKYKVWHPKSKVMELMQGYGSADKGIFELDNGEIDDIYLQFTGLKDKYGKEIYEGYILQYDEENYPNKEIKKVWWNNGSFMLGGQIINECQLSKLWKVVGNIYENPELLKEVDKK